MKHLPKYLITALASSPVLLFAFTAGPPLGRTGAAVDGGLACNACHRGADLNDGRGRIRITAAAYTPGMRQRISVRVEHPDATKWGFEITARLQSDNTRTAGNFTANDDVQVRCAAAPLPAGNPPVIECGPAGLLQFASHRAASTNPDTRMGRTWEFDWTPPDTNMGAITFFAAGNAANNGGTNAGDFIYTTSTTVSPAAGGGPRPTITSGGIGDAWTGQTSLSSHTWFAVYGANFAGSAIDWSNAIQNNVLPTNLGGVSVTVNGRPASIFFANAGQINALAPLDPSTGDVMVVVTTPNGDSMPVTVRKAAASPAFFALAGPMNRLFTTVVSTMTNPDGSAIYYGNRQADSRVTRGVRRGDTVSLYGTGFGATDPAVTADRVFTTPAELVTAPSIRIGEVNVPIMGGRGNLVGPGLYQFNVTIPMAVATGDQPIVADIGGIRSAATVFITIEQ